MPPEDLRDDGLEDFREEGLEAEWRDGAWASVVVNNMGSDVRFSRARTAGAVSWVGLIGKLADDARGRAEGGTVPLRVCFSSSIFSSQILRFEAMTSIVNDMPGSTSETPLKSGTANMFMKPICELPILSTSSRTGGPPNKHVGI